MLAEDEVDSLWLTAGSEPPRRISALWGVPFASPPIGWRCWMWLLKHRARSAQGTWLEMFDLLTDCALSLLCWVDDCVVGAARELTRRQTEVYSTL